MAQAILKGQCSPEEIQGIKRNCQTNLFYLAHDILFPDRFDDDLVNITERTHRPICDFFVQKNPDKKIAEQDTVKERLLLYPRTSYKSTLDMVDVAQWIICFPNIKVMILTGLDDLAVAFVEELNSYFVLEDPTEPTVFQALFPEFCIGPKDQRQGEFKCPARTRYAKEPTVFSSAIESNNAGWHVDVMKCDDIVTETNSETPERLKKITRKYNMMRKLVMSWGYRDTIGTRYNLDDTYGSVLEKRGIKTSYGHASEGAKFKYLCLPAWWTKGTNYEIPTLDELPNPDSVELLFPEGCGFDFLADEWKSDRESFASQYLNDPIGASDVTFLKSDLIAATVPYSAIPKEGQVFVTWDLAYTKAQKTTRGRDWTVGAVGLIETQGGTEPRVWILDIIRGKYQPHETPYMIAKAIKDWKPVQTGIEDMLGAQWMMPELNRQAQQMQVPLSINWFTISNTKDSMADQVKSLETLLSNGRLKFCSSIGCLEALYREFERFTGSQSGHDDIPVAISYLQKFLPHGLAEQREQREDAMKKQKEQDQFNRIYNLGVYAPPPMEIGYLNIDPYTTLPN